MRKATITNEFILAVEVIAKWLLKCINWCH